MRAVRRWSPASHFSPSVMVSILRFTFFLALFVSISSTTHTSQDDVTSLNARIRKFLADSTIQDNPSAAASNDGRHQPLGPNDAIFGPPTRTNGGSGSGTSDCSGGAGSNSPGYSGPGTNCGSTTSSSYGNTATTGGPNPVSTASYSSNSLTPLPTPGSYSPGPSGGGETPSGPSNTYYIKAIGELWPGSLVNSGGSGAFPTGSSLGNYPGPPPNSPSRGGGNYPAPVAPTDYVATVTTLAPLPTGGYAQTTAASLRTTAAQCLCPCSPTQYAGGTV